MWFKVAGDPHQYLLGRTLSTFGGISQGDMQGGIEGSPRQTQKVTPFSLLLSASASQHFVQAGPVLDSGVPEILEPPST